MKRKMLQSKKRLKLSGRSKQLASKFIAEEIRSGIPQRQSLAIGLSRARSAQQKAELDKIVARYI